VYLLFAELEQSSDVILVGGHQHFPCLQRAAELNVLSQGKVEKLGHYLLGDVVDSHHVGGRLTTVAVTEHGLKLTGMVYAFKWG
jgi:hypothetical protein